MVKATESLPVECRQKVAAGQSKAFAIWKAKAVAYNGLGRKELLHGVLSKQQLTPPLLSDIVHLRFSPDGNYILAQNDAGVNVLSREPFAPLFRIDTEFDTYYANFTPDSKEIVFYSDNLRIERWNIAEAQRTDVKEVVLLKGCLQGNDRIAGINPETVKKSADVNFPGGEVVAEMELWRKGMTGATRGDYLLIRPVKDYAVGVMDINSKTITKANERAALDIYEPYFIAEMRNGQVGLYKLEKNELVATNRRAACLVRMQRSLLRLNCCALRTRAVS
ncbi:MAG: hypothetical protein V7638_4117 [Acidobacteriota bacterium]|jgi:hypothetical protein